MKKNLLTLAFISMIHLASNAQLFDYAWHKNIPSTNFETVDYEFSGIDGDTLFLIGILSYEDSIDLNPGAGYDWITDEDPIGASRIVYMSKYEKNTGAYLGSKKLIEFSDSSGYLYVHDFLIDNNGQLIIAGRKTTNEVDFDPSSNSAGWYSGTNNGQYIAFYSSNGNYTGHIEYTGSVSISSMDVDENNNLYWSGAIYGTVDLDFTAGVDNFTPSNGSYDVAISKIDLSNQNYVWSKVFGGNAYEGADKIYAQYGKLFVLGDFESDTIDFDPSIGQQVKLGSSIGTLWSFISQYDYDGAYQNAIVFGGSDETEIYYSGIDDQGNLSVSGQIYQGDTIDVDPSPLVQLLNTENQDPFFVINYSSNLELNWAKTITSVL